MLNNINTHPSYWHPCPFQSLNPTLSFWSYPPLLLIHSFTFKSISILCSIPSGFITLMASFIPSGHWSLRRQANTGATSEQAPMSHSHKAQSFGSIAELKCKLAGLDLVMYHCYSQPAYVQLESSVLMSLKRYTYPCMCACCVIP